ncbi:MAG: F0F1 ATP synthase subunit epsilon [Bacteroidaceae bacterium]|nr:F0F1 ATP synthase subunit epsilon [Bacteroidaceae bacterium]
MSEKDFTLVVMTPEKTLFNGTVSRVMLPGEKAPFVVLHNHAPLISSLSGGLVEWKANGVAGSLAILGGFADVKDNVVTACVEPA